MMHDLPMLAASTNTAPARFENISRCGVLSYAEFPYTTGECGVKWVNAWHTSPERHNVLFNDAVNWSDGVPFVRRSVYGLSPPRAGLNPRPIRVGTVVDYVVHRQHFFRTLPFSPVHINPPMLYTHSFLYTLPKLILLFYVSFVCKCVLYYCHRVTVAYPGIFFGGGFNKFSWGQRTGIWGR
jgi:hypothetical protein